MRVVWLTLPACVAPGFGAALSTHGEPVRFVAMTLAWAAWVGPLSALLIPRSIGLTALRIVAPAALGLGIWIALDADVSTTSRMVALLAVLVAALGAFAPATGELLVDGSSYGDEHRVLLRAPLALWFGPIPIAWSILVGCSVGGPLLLAAEQWIAGVIVTAVAAGGARFLVNRLHQLSRRWLVFVPAGVVIHDPFTLAEPVLLPRRLLRSVGPAPADNPALDLTAGAPGLALELATVEPIVLTPARAGEEPTPLGVSSTLVTPTRPGHTLGIARERRLPVGWI